MPTAAVMVLRLATTPDQRSLRRPTELWRRAGVRRLTVEFETAPFGEPINVRSPAS